MLKCSVCGNDHFSTVGEPIIDMSEIQEDTEVKCSDCKRIIDKKQLIEENKYIIDSNIEDLKKRCH